jgi:tRNA A-37 threonylcarbamoyl transferase component Bud32
VCGLSLSGEQTAPLPTLLQVLRQATLGEYEIIEELGQGGMATVYLAHEIALDRKVAIKVMSPSLVHGPEMIERFKREARTAAALDHPHIVPIYAVRESEHLVFFVMKYIQGRSLDAILKEVGPLPIPMVRTILADVGSALDYAHRQGVIHRDVKPGNILIDEEGFAFITDFGIAKAAEGAALTRSGTTVGTPSYLSPEACSGDVVGPAADQYSLGIVGYEMITGSLPFTADSSLGMMYAQVHALPRPSEQLRPDCPPDLRQAIMRMLAKSPYDRFPMMKDAVQAIAGGRASGGYASGDEHVRSHVGLLAVARRGRTSGESRRTPSSPAGLPLLPAPVSRPRRRFLAMAWPWVVAGLGFGAAGLALAVRFSEPREAPASAPEPDTAPAQPAGNASADSLWHEARGTAQMARQQAVVAGASEAALASGDSLQTLAESLAALGRKAEAAMLLSRAGVLWAAAKPVVAAPSEGRTPPQDAPDGNANRTQSSPGQISARPPSGQPEPAPARAGTQATADSVAIVAFYDSLAQAIEARQLGEVKRLLPNLTETEERNWRNLFEDRKIRSLDVIFQVRDVTSDGRTGYARVWEEVFVTREGGKTEKKREGLEYKTLTLGPQGWRQIRSEPVRRP